MLPYSDNLLLNKHLNSICDVQIYLQLSSRQGNKSPVGESPRTGYNYSIGLRFDFDSTQFDCRLNRSRVIDVTTVLRTVKRLMQAGSPIQAGGFRSLVPIEVRGLY